MYLTDEDKFRKAFNVRQCEKCCGNCKHFDRDYECTGCAHPKQSEFDSFTKEMQKSDQEYHNEYGAYGGIIINEGNVCDLWESEGETND